jgi:hypothetical protein
VHEHPQSFRVPIYLSTYVMYEEEYAHATILGHYHEVDEIVVHDSLMTMQLHTIHTDHNNGQYNEIMKDTNIHDALCLASLVKSRKGSRGTCTALVPAIAPPPIAPIKEITIN